MVKRSTMKRILALVLSLMLLVALLPTSAFAVSEVDYIAFTSDVHGATGNMEKWIAHLYNSGTTSLDDMIFGGDFNYTESYADETASTCVSLVNATYEDTPIYIARGNHDVSDVAAFGDQGTDPITTSNIGYNTGLVYDGSDYAVYIMDSSSQSFTTDEVDALSEGMADVGTEKPVFVVSHCPLHYITTRTIGNAVSVINVLNNYPNAVFLWGHNHSQSDPSYGTVRVSGDTIAYSSTGSSTIKFTYANMGAMYDGSGNNYGAYGLLTTLTVSSGSTEMNFQYEDLDGTHTLNTYSVTVPTSSTDEISSVALSGITAPEAGQSPDTSAVVSGSAATPGAVTWSPTDDPFEAGVTPVIPSDGRQFYPIVVSAEEDGSYTITSPDFPAIRFSAPSLEYGLQSVPELLQDELAGLVYPPAPTPVNQIMLPEGAFLMQIAPA